MGCMNQTLHIYSRVAPAMLAVSAVAMVEKLSQRLVAIGQKEKQSENHVLLYIYFVFAKFSRRVRHSFTLYLMHVYPPDSQQH